MASVAAAVVVRRWAGVALATLALGCGTRGDASILPDKWPLAGVAGYVLRDVDEPMLLLSPGFELDEPAAQPDPTSGGLTIWGRIARNKQPLPSQIFRARVAELDNPGEPETALEPTLPWEGGGLGGPSFVAAPQPLLFYQGEDGSVGLARLDGDAVTKLTTAAPLATAALLGGGRKVGRVSAALAPAAGADSGADTIRLYYTVDDAELYAAEAPLGSVLSGQAVNWQVRPVKLRAADFQVPPGDSKAVAAEHVSQLSVRRAITPAGRARWDLFLVATAGTESALVAATAYAEPSGHERFAPVPTALLKTSEGTLMSPTGTSFHGWPLLLAALHTVQTGIAAAVLPSSPP